MAGSRKGATFAMLEALSTCGMRDRQDQFILGNVRIPRFLKYFTIYTFNLV